MKTRKMHRELIIYLSFILCMNVYAQQIRGEEIKTSPKWGDNAVYYDINDNGEILEIDYGKQQGRIRGKTDRKSYDPAIIWEGWVSHRYACLIMLEPSIERGWFGRLYLYSMNKMIQKTSLLIDLDGDTAFLPVSETVNYIQYNEFGTKKVRRFVLDMSENGAVRDTFAFDLRVNSIYSISHSDNSMFFAHHSKILKIDLTHNETVSEIDVSPILSSDKKKGYLIFIGAFHKDHGLVTKKNLNDNTTKLYVISLSTLQITAESEYLPFFTGKYYFDENDSNKLIISCVTEKSRSEPTGTIRRFMVKKSKIAPLDSIMFDTEKEIALREKGLFKIYPRYSFDYLSMLTIRKKIVSEIRRFTPDIVSEVRKSVRRIKDKFNADYLRDKRKTEYRHLKITP